MTTVGLDFGTHQTKICCEKVEAGTKFYEVVRFNKSNGEEALTLPSFIRILADDTLQYGHDAVANDVGGQAKTYFKQEMFSWTSNDTRRVEAEQLSVLFLAFVILKLDEYLQSEPYIVQMGMPTDADPHHYDYCKHQAVKVLASAMQLAREEFKGDMREYLRTPYSQLVSLVKEHLAAVPDEIREVRRRYPIFVFPEAYVALIPLIDDHRLPGIGPNLFVDIGGGTVDISFFTNQLSEVKGRNRPHLYYYHSIPYGLNMITEQDLERDHNVEVGRNLITEQRVNMFRKKMIDAIDTMMEVLKNKYVSMELTNVMPFINICGQTLDQRPVCYSGGGSMFDGLKPVLASSHNGISYNFSDVTTVSQLIDHSRLNVDDGIFHILCTAFALSHNSLIDIGRNDDPGYEPDSINLVSVKDLFTGIRRPVEVDPSTKIGGWKRKPKWTW